MIKSLIVDNQLSELNENKLSKNNLNNFVSSFVKPNNDNLNSNKNSQNLDNLINQCTYQNTDFDKIKNTSSSTSSISLSSESSSIASILVEILTKSNESLTKSVSNETLNEKDLNISLSSSSLDSSSFENIYSIYTFYQNSEINKNLLGNYIENSQNDNYLNKIDNFKLENNNSIKEENFDNLNEETDSNSKSTVSDNSEYNDNLDYKKLKFFDDQISNDKNINSKNILQKNIAINSLENSLKEKSFSTECKIKLLQLKFKKQNLTSIVVVWPLKCKINQEISLNKIFSIKLRPTIENEKINVQVKY